MGKGGAHRLPAKAPARLPAAMVKALSLGVPDALQLVRADGTRGPQFVLFGLGEALWMIRGMTPPTAQPSPCAAALDPRALACGCAAPCWHAEALAVIEESHLADATTVGRALTVRRTGPLVGVFHPDISAPLMSRIAMSESERSTVRGYITPYHYAQDAAWDHTGIQVRQGQTCMRCRQPVCTLPRLWQAMANAAPTLARPREGELWTWCDERLEGDRELRGILQTVTPGPVRTVLPLPDTDPFRIEIHAARVGTSNVVDLQIQMAFASRTHLVEIASMFLPPTRCPRDGASTHACWHRRLAASALDMQHG